MNEAIESAVAKTIELAQVPGMALAVARRGQPVEHLYRGADAEGAPIQSDSLFPIASITKLAVALTVLRLVDRGNLAIDDPLAAHLPEAAAAQPGVTLRKLLCHTSGLPADVAPAAAPYHFGLSWPKLARACLERPLQAPPDTRVEYSNVGYGLLAIVVERKTAQPFATALARLVLEPLGIEGYLGVEPPRAPARLAGIHGKHAGTDLEAYNSAFWRSLALPWCGLLTTVDGALSLVQAFDGYPSGFLRPETLAEATRNQVGDLSCKLFGLIPWAHCHWGLGPEIRDAKKPHWAPPEASSASFGHAGQSGCLAWSDPAAGVAWAYFGARTADSGWLLKRAPAIGSAILASAGERDIQGLSG